MGKNKDNLRTIRSSWFFFSANTARIVIFVHLSIHNFSGITQCSNRFQVRCCRLLDILSQISIKNADVWFTNSWDAILLLYRHKVYCLVTKGFENTYIASEIMSSTAQRSIQARHLLNNNCPNVWIRRGSEIGWPSYSPDLTPCDFFFGVTWSQWFVLH